MRSVSLSRSSSVVAEAAPSILSGCSSAKLPSLLAAAAVSPLLCCSVAAAAVATWNVQV